MEEVTNYLRAFRWVQAQLRDPKGLPISVRLLYSAIRKEAIGGYSMVREARGSSLVNCAGGKIGSAEHELATPYLCRRHQSAWPNCWPTWSGSFTIQRRFCLPW